MNTVPKFTDAALAQTDGEFGYFIEGAGWDSGYNGVATMLAMELYLSADEARTKNKLGKSFHRASAHGG